ncbi:MAG: class II fructose-1,6-bisphosphate aldolase [Tissierellia bacterium]|nr:class II fructose-1,6-bisphosphate aldolase [Tissierellia bacterium]
MLVNGKRLLEDARDKGYAVGAFNVNNMEIVQAIIEAAEETQSPCILQASQGAIKYAGLDFLFALAKTAAEITTVPVAIHLDHGTDFDQIVQCIRAGFSSIMIDASKYPLEENIERTKRVVEIAKPINVTVEAELGKIGGTEDQIVVDERDATYTDPEEAKIFVEKTGVDSLAVAVGTAHGVYKGEPKLDFDRIEALSKAVSCPLVLHGSSGVPYDALKKAISLGISKVNIDTDLRLSFTDGLKDFLKENRDNFDPRKILGPARENMKKAVIEKMEVFGSVGKAWR